MSSAHTACEIYYLPKECWVNHSETETEMTDNVELFKNCHKIICSERTLFSLELGDGYVTNTNNETDANTTHPLSKFKADDDDTKKNENKKFEVKINNYTGQESMLKCLNHYHQEENVVEELFCKEGQEAENVIDDYHDTVSICEKVKLAGKNANVSSNSESCVTTNCKKNNLFDTNMPNSNENKAADKLIFNSTYMETLNKTNCLSKTESEKCEDESSTISEIYNDYDSHTTLDIALSKLKTSSNNLVNHIEQISDSKCEYDNDMYESCSNSFVEDENCKVNENNLGTLHSHASCSSLGMSTNGMSNMEFLLEKEEQQYEEEEEYSLEEQQSAFRKNFDVSSYCNWDKEDNYSTTMSNDIVATNICVNNDADNLHCDTWHLLAPLGRDLFCKVEFNSEVNTNSLCEGTAKNADDFRNNREKETENMFNNETLNELSKLVDISEKINYNNKSNNNNNYINNNNDSNAKSNTNINNVEVEYTCDNRTRDFSDTFFSSTSCDEDENNGVHLSKTYSLEPRLNTLTTNCSSLNYHTNLSSVFTIANSEFPSRCSYKIKEIKNALREFPYIHPFFNIDWQETQREIENRQRHAEYCTLMTKSASLSAHDAMIACKILLNEAHRVYRKRFEQFNVRRNNVEITEKFNRPTFENSRKCLTNEKNIKENEMGTVESVIQKHCHPESITTNTEQTEIDQKISNVNNDNNKNNRQQEVIICEDYKDDDFKWYQKEITFNKLEECESTALEENNICTTSDDNKSAPLRAVRTRSESFIIFEEEQHIDEVEECKTSNESISSNYNNIIGKDSNIVDKTNGDSHSSSKCTLNKEMPNEGSEFQKLEWENKREHDTQWRDIERFVENDLYVEGYPFVQRRISCMCVFNPLSDDRFYCDNEVAREQRVNRQRAILLQLRRQAAVGRSPYFLEHRSE